MNPLRDLLAQYELLRKKLVLLFRQNGFADPENLADETIARTVSKLSEGDTVITTTVRGYVFGIAYNIVHEERKKRSFSALDDSVILQMQSKPEDVETSVFIDECLRVLPTKERTLLWEYHTEPRDQLASRLGIKPEGLRVRYHRAMERVRDHVEQRKSSVRDRKARND